MASSSDDEIQVLRWQESPRRRPGMYVGDASVAGLHQLVFMLVDVALDLHRQRRVTEVRVDISRLVGNHP